jgi:hypothetical protein
MQTIHDEKEQQGGENQDLTKKKAKLELNIKGYILDSKIINVSKYSSRQYSHLLILAIFKHFSNFNTMI